MMDEDFDIDIDDVKSKIANAETLSLFFPMLRSSLIIDYRCDNANKSFLKIMPMVASPQERLRTIRRLRPGLPRLQSFILIPWARYIDSLRDQGIWDLLTKKFEDLTQHDSLVDIEKIFLELKRLEKLEYASIVMGDNFHTLWSSSI